MTGCVALMRIVRVKTWRTKSQGWRFVWQKSLRNRVKKGSSKMTKRNLTTVVTVILSTSTLYAHPNWGVQTGMNWQWARKSATPVSVKLKIEPWAEIYCSNGENLILQQQTGSNNYSGCAQLNLLNNFQNLMNFVIMITS